MANTGMTHEAVCHITRGLEKSPSLTQGNSTLLGTKGKLERKSRPSKGGDGGGTRHKKGSKLGHAERM